MFSVSSSVGWLRKKCCGLSGFQISFPLGLYILVVTAALLLSCLLVLCFL